MKEMKIVKETKLGEKDWYCIFVNDTYFRGDYDLEAINLLYEQIKENPNLHLKTREVIKSTQINID